MSKTDRLLLGIFLLLCTCMTSLRAQQPIDLKAALNYALDHHNAIKNAEIDVLKGKQMIREALSAGLPQLNANLGMTNNLALRTSLVPANFFGGPPGEFARLQFGTNWIGNAGVQLDQMLFSKTWLIGLEATRELQDFYELSLSKSKEDVVYEVARLYYQIQLSKTQRGLIQANLSQIDGLHKVAQKQFENGFGKKIDVDRLQVQQSNLQIQLSNLDLQLRQLTLALKLAMQMPLETDIVLTDSISESNLLNVDQPIAQPYFQDRPMLSILKKQQELYSLDERRWRAGYFPTFSFFANYTYEWQADQFSDISKGLFWNDYSQVGIHASIPIFDGFFKDSKIQTAQLNGMQMANQHSLVLLSYQLQYESAKITVRVHQNNLRAVNETLGVAQSVYRVAQSRYREGLAPITELLDAETSMREAQSNYITTLANIKLAEIDLLYSNGQLMKLAE